MRPHAVALLAALAWVVTACTQLEALTPPPPGRIASLDAKDHVVELSVGVALAFKCTTSGGNPCDAGQATVDDRKIANVYPAHLERLEWYTSGMSMPTSYVVVGTGPGETTLHIPGESPLRIIVRQ